MTSHETTLVATGKWVLRTTTVMHFRTAPCEGTTDRRGAVDIRGLRLSCFQSPAWGSDRVEESLRVRMQWGMHDLLTWPVLDDPSTEEDEDPIGQEAGRSQIVGDQEDRELASPLEFREKLEDPHPNRNVEHRCGLVCDEKVGVDGKGSCNRHPLPLPSGKLVGMAIDEVFGWLQTNGPQQVKCLGPDVALLDETMTKERASQVMFDVVGGIKRPERILKDHLNPGSVAKRGSFRLRLQNVLAVEQDFSGVSRLQTEHETSYRRLAASGLPDQGRCLASFEAEGDVLRGDN